jgi:hypothetical protein
MYDKPFQLKKGMVLTSVKGTVACGGFFAIPSYYWSLRRAFRVSGEYANLTPSMLAEWTSSKLGNSRNSRKKKKF